ncbi:MAG: heavy metal translocating P-type ATPase, partial [Sphingobium sp.]
MTCCPAPLAGTPDFAPDLAGDEARRWISTAGPGLSRIELIVPEANCAACIPGIEDVLKPMPGVEKARLNLTARRVSITWRTAEAEPQSFIDRLAALGYSCRPVDPNEAGFSGDAVESRRLLSALAVAGFAAANVMLLSVSVWSGADPVTRDLFHWISAAIALPAVVYSGRPFFSSAAAAIRRGMVNMDVPISLGVLLAAGMSLFETIEHGEHAYFDAAITLLFFLLAGRYLDHMMRARARSAISQ